MTAPLTPGEIADAFRRAVHSYANADVRWAARRATGQTDDQLAEALAYELGAMGGSSGPGVSIEFTRTGLRMWAARGMCNRAENKPVLAGPAMIRYAREYFGISDPVTRQGSLF